MPQEKWDYDGITFPTFDARHRETLSEHLARRSPCDVSVLAFTRAIADSCNQASLGHHSGSRGVNTPCCMAIA